MKERLGRGFDEPIEVASLLGPESSRYVTELVLRLKRVLEPKLEGVYLHGSGALGDFTPSRSDIDIIAVSSARLSGDERTRLREELSPAALPCPAAGLEFHVVDRKSLGTVAESPLFEVHVATDSRNRTEKFVDGHGHKGDTDLVMHYAVLKAHGITLAGPPASEVFPEVPRHLLLRAFRDELAWAARHASPSYQVLNAARAWRFVDENVICSKTEGAEWARSRVADASVKPCSIGAA